MAKKPHSVTSNYKSQLERAEKTSNSRCYGRDGSASLSSCSCPSHVNQLHWAEDAPAQVYLFRAIIHFSDYNLCAECFKRLEI
ncbi:hypothetical protein STEG23_003510, partial [Scotinomys teguina]